MKKDVGKMKVDTAATKLAGKTNVKNSSLIFPVFSNTKGGSTIVPIAKSPYKKTEILAPLFDIIDTGICVTDEAGYFVDLNEAYSKIYGYTKKEMIGTAFKLVIPTKSYRMVQKTKNLLYQHKIVKPTSLKVKHKDGSLIHITMSCVLIKHTDKKEYVITSIKDITQQKNAEANLLRSEDKYRSIIETSSSAFFLTDSDGKILDASKAAISMFGYTLARLKKMGLQTIINNNDLDNLLLIKRHFKDYPIKGFITGIRKNKTLFPCEFSSVLFKEINGEIRTSTMIVDISERTLAEEKIKQSEENLRAVFENTKEGFVLIDTNYLIKTCNYNARYNLFTQHEMLPGTNIFNYIEVSGKEDFKTLINKAFTGETFQHERLVINKFTNEPLWINFSITPVMEIKKAIAVCITGRDITEQKLHEQQIAQIQNLLNRAENIAGIGSSKIDFSTNKQIWSDEFYKIIGLVPGSVPSSADGILQFLHPDEKDAYLKWRNNTLTNKLTTQQLETRLITTAGKEKNIIAYSATTYNEKGNKNTSIEVIQDITERKKMEMELQASHEIYKTLFYQNPAGVFSLDMNGYFTSVNKILSVKTGCSEDDFLKLHYSVFLHPGEIDIAKEHFEKAKLGEIQEFEMKIITASGNIINVSMVNLPIIINNKITGIYCVTNDITNDVNAKKVFDKTLADRQRILDYSLDVICEFDQYGIFIQVSKACKESLGYEVEELIGKGFINFIAEDDKNLSIKAWEILKAGGAVKRNFENRYIKKDGSIVSLIWSLRWEEKDKTMYCIAKDASEIKAQEQALILSEKRYRDLFNNNPLPLFIYNLSNQYIIEVNNAALKKYGYTREEFLWLTISDISTAESFQAFENLIKNHNDLSDFSTPIWTHIKSDSELMYMKITANMIDYNGNTCVLILSDDVTEKIKAQRQQDFERSEKEALINNTNDLIWSVSRDFKLIAGNNSFINAVHIQTGKVFTPGDYLLAKELFSTDLQVTWQKMYSNALNGKTFKKELVITDITTGLLLWNEVSFNPIYNGKEVTGIACYSRNITESKLYHNELLNINKKLQAAQQMARLGYWEIDIHKNNSFWSDELYHIYGLKKTDRRVPLLQILALIHPDDKKKAVKNYWLTIEKRQPLNYEHRIILKDGSVKVVMQKGTLIFNKQGIPITLEGTSQDITQQKMAEKAIKDSEEKYRMIFNSNPLPNWIYDLETLKILKVNNAAITHYGYTGDEFLNMYINDIFIEDEKAAVIKMNKAINKTGIINFGQWLHIKKNGKEINVAISGHAITYNDKNAVMIVSNDITEIIISQQALIKSNERFEYATRATFDAIWDHDIINNTMFWGEGFNTLFGYDIKKLKVSTTSRRTYTHPDDQIRVFESMNLVINDPHQTYWKSEYRFKKMNGEYATVIDCALVVKDTYGIPYRIIGAMQDITERIKNVIVLKELNNQLNKRAAELAISNAELEQFAYIASHDLQEPLRMVSSFLGQLQKKYDPQLDENGRLYIRFAVDGAVRMRKIINDLLEYSRVGTQQYRYEKINTNDLLNEIVGMYTNIINEKKIVISYGLLPTIVASKTSMQQLFQNIISNAIKYQHPGVVPHINISGIEMEDHWHFSITDNGIGINTEYFNKIFVLFQRLHNKDEYSGTGIGLAICKKIIDNYKGKLWVESSSGKGSTFCFDIPKVATNV